MEHLCLSVKEILITITWRGRICLEVQSPGHEPEAAPDRFKGSINHPGRPKEGDGRPYGSINHPEHHINSNAPTTKDHQINLLIILVYAPWFDQINFQYYLFKICLSSKRFSRV